MRITYILRLLALFTLHLSRWFTAHWIIQLIISGPVIFAGWSMGYNTSEQLQLGHFVDPHQKMGLTLLILYVVQVVIGALIHFVKMPSFFRGRRPPQNYFHVFLGLVIFILAESQVNCNRVHQIRQKYLYSFSGSLWLVCRMGCCTGRTT